MYYLYELNLFELLRGKVKPTKSLPPIPPSIESTRIRPTTLYFPMPFGGSKKRWLAALDEYESEQNQKRIRL